jgi:hypothetical protein
MTLLIFLGLLGAACNALTVLAFVGCLAAITLGLAYGLLNNAFWIIGTLIAAAILSKLARRLNSAWAARDLPYKL